MDKLSLLEARLAEALQALDESAEYVRESEELETHPNLRLLGYAINYIGELREAIHRIRPDLKPDFVAEYEQDRQRYEALQELAKQAYDAEKQKDFDKASQLSSELAEKAQTGYFRLVAEASLYRLSKEDRSA